MTEAASKIFLPLRTAVELFDDPSNPAPTTRAKLAAILFDEVAFEAGLLEVSIGDTGSTRFWIPPDDLTPEQLERSRQLQRKGQPFQLAMGFEPSVGEPPEEMHTVMQFNTSMAYSAQWHTHGLDELMKLEAPWITAYAIGGSDPPRSDPLGKWIANENFRNRGDKKLLKDMGSFEQSYVYEGFNRDRAYASFLDSALALTPMFDPLIQARSDKGFHEGSEALSVIVPNIGALEWESILSFREHQGAVEARSRLREFEEQASRSEPEDAHAFFKSVAQEVAQGFQGAIADQSFKAEKEIAKEVARTGVAFVPGVGPLLDKGSVALEIANKMDAERRSWTSALLRLGAVKTKP